jgi:AraC-like DNA-binding protein
VAELAAGRFRLTYRQLANLLELAAVELQCPDFGMRLARRQSECDELGPLGTVMNSSKTFGGALNYVCDHNYAHSLAARVWLQRLSPDGSVFVGHDILLDGLPNKSQVMEQVLLTGHLTAQRMTGGRARVRRIHFRHRPVSSLGTYRRHFGCEVRFDQNEDGVVYSAEDLAQPIVDPDEQAFQAMVAFIDSQFTDHKPPMHAEVRGVVMRLLGTGDCSNERVAQALNVHLRTLHRRLSREETSFQRVKDEVRRDVMLYYLQQTDLDFARISEKLGFSEQSVMTRRCNHWFAASPTRVRQQGPHASATR